MMEVAQFKKPQEAVYEPHNVELEQQIIGNVLLNNDLIHKVGVVQPEHFYDPVHGEIWKAISSRINDDHMASPVTMASDFQSHKGLLELGGTSYFARLAGGAMSSFAMADYSRDLIELYRQRQILNNVGDVLQRVRGGMKAQDAQSEIELYLQAQEAYAETPRSMSLLAAHTQSINMINQRYQSGKYGKSTGLKALDNITGGLHDGEATTIAGSTSMGKTALGCWLAYHLAKSGYMVGIASLEMSEIALANRLNSIDSGIPYQDMRGEISESTFRAVVDGAKSQEALPIHVYSDQVNDMPAILSETRRLQRMHPPNGNFLGFGLLVIDYIQLVKGKGDGSVDILSRIANDVKRLAKLLNIPVVALAQVMRDLGKRENPIPQLSDLRGSSDLENAPDNVIFCHRPEYYIERDLRNPNLKIEDRADLEAALSASRNKMQLLISKQRMGAIGQCTVEVDMARNRFRDVDTQEEWEF